MIGIIPAAPGSVRIHVIDGVLVRVELLNERLGAVHLQPFTKEFREYLHGRRSSFNLPFAFSTISATPFQEKVFRVVLTIPYGEVLTYSEVGRRIDPERGTKLARAVGQALKKNPLPIVIPCHRVVGKGDLGGFSHPLSWKVFLLSLERDTSKAVNEL